MKRTFDLSKAPVAKGDFSRLGELHNLSSGLKSYCTDLAANGIETCRRALGGHGYGGYSGLKQLNDDYLSKPTVEGDNWMITQQVAKYLIKIVGKVLQQSPEPATDEVNGVEAAIARFARGDRKPPSIKFDGSEEGDVSLVRAFEFNMAYQVGNRLSEFSLPQMYSNYFLTTGFRDSSRQGSHGYSLECPPPQSAPFVSRFVLSALLPMTLLTFFFGALLSGARAEGSEISLDSEVGIHGRTFCLWFFLELSISPIPM